MQSYLKIHSSRQWQEHLAALAQRCGLRNKQMVVEEAVKLLAEAAGMPPCERFRAGLDRTRLDLARVRK